MVPPRKIYCDIAVYHVPGVLTGVKYNRPHDDQHVLNICDPAALLECLKADDFYQRGRIAIVVSINDHNREMYRQFQAVFQKKSENVIGRKLKDLHLHVSEKRLSKDMMGALEAPPLKYQPETSAEPCFVIYSPGSNVNPFAALQAVQEIFSETGIENMDLKGAVRIPPQLRADRKK